jgi:hypothetical protein
MCTFTCHVYICRCHMYILYKCYNNRTVKKYFISVSLCNGPNGPNWCLKYSIISVVGVFMVHNTGYVESTCMTLTVNNFLTFQKLFWCCISSTILCYKDYIVRLLHRQYSKCTRQNFYSSVMCTYHVCYYTVLVCKSYKAVSLQVFHVIHLLFRRGMTHVIVD